MMKIQEIIKILKNDGVGVLRTDTLYGLVGCALSKKAVERIYKIKKRPPTSPLIILVSKVEDMSLFGIEDTFIKTHTTFLKNIWPAPISIVVPSKLKKFAYLDRGTQSLAFRLPDDKNLRGLLKQTGPLVAPSANLSGFPSARNEKEAFGYFGNQIDFIESRNGKPNTKSSTLISLVNDTPELLRVGAVLFNTILKKAKQSK